MGCATSKVTPDGANGRSKAQFIQELDARDSPQLQERWTAGGGGASRASAACQVAYPRGRLIAKPRGTGNKVPAT